jgi:DNA-binding MarR family transcriptional regulator
MKRSTERTAESMMKLVKLFYVIRLRESGVKPPPYDAGFWTLWLLLDGGLPISEIGRRLDRSKPAMTALISKLIRRGMARRVPDKRDHRVVRIEITGKGREYMREKRSEVKGSITEVLADLDDGRIERLCSSLEEVNSIMESLK